MGLWERTCRGNRVERTERSDIACRRQPREAGAAPAGARKYLPKEARRAEVVVKVLVVVGSFRASRSRRRTVNSVARTGGKSQRRDTRACPRARKGTTRRVQNRARSPIFHFPSAIFHHPSLHPRPKHRVLVSTITPSACSPITRPNTRNQEPRTKNQEPRTKNQEPRTKNQEPRTSHLVSTPPFPQPRRQSRKRA